MVWVTAALPLILLVLGFPIFQILLATSTLALLFFMNVPLTAVHQVIFGSIDKFALMAVPFFIFAGEIMGRGGISRRIVEFVMSAFGWVRGALPITTVGTCTIFGAMSGSGAATVAAIGQLLHGPLRQRGYNEKFATGLITSAGAIATVIPPSLTMILYGASAEQSVAQLFVAGIVPGLLLAGLMVGYIMIYARWMGINDSQPFDLAAFLRSSRNAVLALGTPVIILGGIYTGMFTETESAGIACVYAIIVTRLIYGELSWKGIWSVSVSSMYLTAQVLIIVAAAGVFSWILTVNGVPATVVAYIRDFSVEPWAILLAINILLLIVGCLIDPASAVLVLTPLLVPIVKAAGIDLVHFGIIVTVNLEIGLFTPPFGLNIFVSQALFKVPLKVLYPGLVPFIGIHVLGLGLVTYIPELSLYLTRFLG